MEMSIVVNNNNEKVVKKKVLGGNFNMDFYNEIEKINESTTNFLEKLVKNEYKNNEKLLEKIKEFEMLEKTDYEKYWEYEICL